MKGKRCRLNKPKRVFSSSYLAPALCLIHGAENRQISSGKSRMPHKMVMVRRKLKILDETGLLGKNWKKEIAKKMNEIVTKKRLGGS